LPPPSGYFAANPHPTKTEGGVEDFTVMNQEIRDSGKEVWEPTRFTVSGIVAKLRIMPVNKLPLLS
jgi:hypothetical protein